jgi:hypothetical protein
MCLSTNHNFIHEVMDFVLLLLLLLLFSLAMQPSAGYDLLVHEVS